MKELKGDTSIPLRQLSIGRAPVLAVSATTPAIETFRLMDNKHISGVAVLDAAGAVVAVGAAEGAAATPLTSGIDASLASRSETVTSVGRERGRV